MHIQLTWHLLLMIVITVFFIVLIFREQESSLDFSLFFYGFILSVIWLIYGGIFFW